MMNELFDFGDDAKSTKPFIKWIGGKRYLLPEIVKLMPATFNEYWEPFLGGGAVFFHICNRIKKAYLSDINSKLMTTYEAIRNNPDQVSNMLAEMKENHCEDYYYQVREEYNGDNQDPISVSASLIYLNKSCFNGLYRENLKGKFNASFGNENPMVSESYGN